MNIIIFLLIILVLVISHEWGHFFSAKKFGIRVDEFGFGMGPKLFGFKKGETEYTINLFPIGGFVKIFGENGEDEDDKEKRGFTKKPAWQQAIVLLAGVFMNFVLAFFIYSFGFMSGVMPIADSPNAKLTILDIMKDSPAESSQIKKGEVILKISDSKKVIENPNAEAFINFLKNEKEKSINISGITKNKEEVNHKVELSFDKDGKINPIGVSVLMVGYEKFGFLKSFSHGFKQSISSFKETTVGLASFVKNIFLFKADFRELAGPVGMVSMVGAALSFGFGGLLYFIATISISLAVLNLFPFPALDGGRLIFVLIEKIKGSKIKPEITNIINFVGFALLMLLMLVITYHDILRLN